MSNYTFIVNTVEEIRHLPDTWQVTDYRRLLDVLDIDGVDADADLAEMALMALQDHEAEEAMHIVLTNFTDGRFSKGQMQNLCEELKEDSAWEEYPDIGHQCILYSCVDLLNMAFPHVYPEPAARAIQLTMTGRGLGDAQTKRAIDAATILRAVGRCQDSGSILNRFFQEQIGGAAFPEAESVIWHLETVIIQADQVSIHFCGSAYWFRDVNEGDEFSCDFDWPE